MSTLSLSDKVKHLYWRAGCGPSWDDLASSKNIAYHVNKIFDDAKTFEALSIIPMGMESTASDQEMADAKALKSNRKMERVALGYHSLEKMAFDKSFLREKMAFFWSSHFACKTNFSDVAVKYINTVREHALGTFPDLLNAISKDACMMSFLNTKKNKKLKPNENFARELLELFTLGRGHYTEKDVKEAARAFTGWDFNKQYVFYINTPYHDNDSKTFLGVTGNLSGDDILATILQQKQCAYFITHKIYRYFVNEIPDEARIKVLSELFFASGYNIEKLMRTIFEADWFYDTQNIGIKIKSPMDLLGGIMKLFEVKMHDPSRFLAYMRMTGQEIFQPPNVAGWPIGKGWIDNSLLMVRLNLPFWLFEKKHPVIQPAETYDAQDIMTNEKNKESVSALITYDFKALNKRVAKTGTQELIGFLSRSLLIKRSVNTNSSLVAEYIYGSDPVKATTVRILSLPEYQLC